ncbi:helix-turn-helix domain-containing protein [Nocardioides sp. NPDC000441]|uniref:PucR family transcriptional regulator n=1 Tax=Nocardioides sp. NPDC000441 TaxID=3154256 RepID=UPI00332C7839
MATEPACTPETIAAAIDQVGPEPVAWAVELGARIAENCIREFPVFDGGRAAVTNLRYGTEQVALYMVRSLDAGRLFHAPLSAETVSMIQYYVRRRVSMDQIWAGMRFGHKWLADEFMTACHSLVGHDDRADELEAVSQILFEQVITYASELGELYRVENEKWMSGPQFARDDALRAVLAGEDADEDKLSAKLGYSLAKHHVGLVLRALDDDPATDLRAVAKDLLHAFGAQAVLVTTDCDGTVGSGDEVSAWGGFDRGVSADELIAGRSVKGASVAVGVGGRGAEGFRTATDEAKRTARIAEQINSGITSNVVSYDQVSLVGLLLENADQAAAFAHHELGSLAENSSKLADLRETVLAYFECRHSPRTAAERLFIAKNTVIYRLKRAEELLGRSLDERPAETWAALLIARGLYDQRRD